MHIYTLDEAQALLPRLARVLEDIREAYTRLRALRAARSADAGSARADGHATVDAMAETAEAGEPERLQAQLRSGTEQLAAWGIELKDPARGLVDFYHERDGEVVFLCYLLGEEEIAFWHELQAGFAGRQPV